MLKDSFKSGDMIQVICKVSPLYNKIGYIELVNIIDDIHIVSVNNKSVYLHTNMMKKIDNLKSFI